MRFRGVLPTTMVVILILAQGCASTKFRKATDPTTNGIRYYLPATYILVKPDYDKQQATISFWTGPDTSTPYAADPMAFASTNTTELQFNKGMLSEVSSAEDSTALAKSVISSLDQIAQSVLGNAAKAAALAAAEIHSPQMAGDQPPIYLFIATKDGSLKQIYGPAN